MNFSTVGRKMDVSDQLRLFSLFLILPHPSRGGRTCSPPASANHQPRPPPPPQAPTPPSASPSPSCAPPPDPGSIRRPPPPGRRRPRHRASPTPTRLFRRASLSPPTLLPWPAMTAAPPPKTPNPKLAGIARRSWRRRWGEDGAEEKFL
jgi:hypothetical protein